MSVNPVVDRRTKHVEIRYHFICEQVELGSTEIFYVATEDQLADSLTKNVPYSVVAKFVDEIGLVSIAS